jgi:3-oxoadipate enol-lactonase
MPIVQLNPNLEMYYEVHGEGEPLILINGLKSDHTGWMPMLDKLKEEFQVILLDNRAVGQTKDNGLDFSIADMANDVVALMDYLDISSSHIAGHSMGGAIAQVLAHEHADRVESTLLCNTFIKFNDDASQGFGNVLKLFQNNSSRREIMEAVIPLVFSENMNTAELRDQIITFVESDPHWQTVHDYQRQLKALNDFDSSAWVGEIDVPTVVVGSHVDITALPAESEEIAARITDAKLEMLPGGHASSIEQPGAFIELFIKHIVSNAAAMDEEEVQRNGCIGMCC